MKFYYLYILFLLFLGVSCSTQDIDEEVPVIPKSEPQPISIGLKTGGTDLPDGPSDFYGLYCVEHAYNETFSWNPPTTQFNSLMRNLKGHISGGNLVFDTPPAGGYRYPINDYMSAFLYYPYNAVNAEAEPLSIAVDRKVEIDNGVTIADKYPDYLAGKKRDISVVGGTPEIPSDAVVPMKHIMARVRFQIKNPGITSFTLTKVQLTGITWKGTMKLTEDLNQCLFEPTIGEIPESLTLIETFLVNGTVEAQHMQINSIYNYSDKEVNDSGDVYDEDNFYYLLVPPLEEAALQYVKLKIDFSRDGVNYSIDVDMKQINIAKWLSGTSYCYTIPFNTYMIERVDAQIEPWKEDIYEGGIIDLQD